MHRAGPILGMGNYTEACYMSALYLQVHGELKCGSGQRLVEETQVDHGQSPCGRLDQRGRIGHGQLQQVQSFLPQGTLWDMKYGSEEARFWKGHE